MGKKKKRQSGTKNKSIVEEVFERERSALRNSGGKRRTIEQLELVEPWYTRRVRAVEHYLPLFEERYAEKYPELDSEVFAECCCTPSVTYDTLETDSGIALAAAIWILDRLQENGRKEAAEKLLAGIPEAALPELFDLTHTNEEIARVLSAITLRYHEADETRLLLPKAMLTEKTESAEHQRFKDLLELLSKDKREQAAAHFREKTLEWMDIQTELEEKYRIERQGLCSELERKEQKLSLLEQKTEQGSRGGPKAQTVELPDPAALLKPGFGFQAAAEQHMEKLLALRLLEEIETLEDKLDSVDVSFRSLRFRAPLLQCLSLNRLRNEGETELTEPFLAFSVEDPYEICFGFLELLESGDDLPWLYYYPSAVAAAAAARLPWMTRRLEPEYAGTVYTPLADLSPYELKFKDKDAPLWGSDRVNQAQLLFRMSRGLLPRLGPNQEDASRLLRECSVPKAKREAFLLLGTLLSLIRKGPWKTEAAETAVQEDGEAALETLRQEVRQLRQENERLKQNAYEARKEAKAAEEHCETLATEAERTRQELSELGDYVFHMQEEETDEEAERTELTFPQRTEHRMVAFGGHDSWSREIRKKLPDVRFVDRNQVPSPELIRRADAIWVQPNSISHARFNAILDMARKHDIPFHYFSYASAAKCAEQLVRLDRSLK